MICRGCGAASPPGTGRFCSHCGRELGATTALLPPARVVDGGALAVTPRDAAALAVSADALPAPPSQHAARFAAARRDPDLAAALQTSIATPASLERARFALPLVGVLLACWIAATASHRISPAWSAIVLALLAVCAAVGRQALRDLRAPYTSALAVVIDRRSGVRVRGGDDVATDHFGLAHRALLELEDGRRLALTGDDAALATLVDGDCGVAYVKGGRLLGFRRLRA